jgi:peptidyl-prolyl cis-trans isomerase SurA
MDRRIVAGLVGVLWAGLTGEVLAQSVPTRDPSAQPAVGMGPIRSLNDTINSTDITLNPNVVPIASSRVPTSPVGSGPAAAIPSPPVLNEPVSMTPIDPLHESLSKGFGSGRIASLFRRPGARPTTPASRTTSARLLPGFGSTPASSRFATVPAPELMTQAPTPRPAPYAARAPEMARPQADPVVVPAANGRPSPYDWETPPNVKPSGPTPAQTPNPRPQLDPAHSPNYRPIESQTTPAPAPVVLPDLPAERPAVIPLPAVELPAPPPLGEIPASPTVGATEGAPASLPVLEKIETVSSPPPAAATELSSAALPELATIETPAKAAAPVVADPSKTAPTLVDDQVKRTSDRTSDDPSALKINDRKVKEQNYITFRAAAVGNEIITINELQEAVKIQMTGDPMLQGMEKNSAEYRAIMNQVAATTLNNLIDQRLLIQEAKAKMKGKGEQAFNEFIENLWRTEELPALKNRYRVANVHELKMKLREEGKNYDTLKEAYCKKQMAHEFIRGEIRHQVTFDQPELRAYYNAHLSEFVKDARMTWREIEVNVGRYPDRATARRKADELLARLLHNESFETIARNFSNGPTASQGGVYVDMTPGSYGIPSVNDELNRIPVGQISQVIEAPNSFHIIRVESRREKGPLHFAEVQEEIKMQVFMINTNKAINQYLAKLRSKTLIRTMFESTPEGLVAAGGTAPSPKTDQAVKPAANR